VEEEQIKEEDSKPVELEQKATKNKKK